ncbi:MAG: tetratricopeptide repeat protein [Nitrospira sp.]|nr:tetratricopeptide repeat protein [Nitrospira sp.]
MARWLVMFCGLAMILMVEACSETPATRAAKHEVRGDGYVQQEQFREAMIEFKNAVRAAPDNPSLQWKLAKAALKGGDPSTAYQALGRVVQLDPSHFEAKWSLGDLYLAGGKMDEVGRIVEELVGPKGRSHW